MNFFAKTCIPQYFMSTEDYVSQHGDALERAISAAVQKAIVARATDPLAYVARELSVAAGPTELRDRRRAARALRL